LARGLDYRSLQWEDRPTEGGDLAYDEASRGLPDRKQTDAFLSAGYGERQILEIVLAMAVKTLSNYANHLFHTPLDPAFEGRPWVQQS